MYENVCIFNEKVTGWIKYFELKSSMVIIYAYTMMCKLMEFVDLVNDWE